MHITVVFVVYVAFVPLFAVIYYSLYRRYPGHFVFVRDIGEARLADRVREAEQRIRSLRLLIGNFEAVLEEHRDGHQQFAQDHDTHVARLADGRQIILERQEQGYPHGGTMELLPYARLLASDDTLIWQGRVEHPGLFLSEFANADEYVRAVFEPLKGDLAAAEVERVRLNKPGPVVWGFVDFLYFSTITQSTVGYGDILPNSTVIRAFVVGQIITGYAILIVILNIVLTSRQAGS